LESRRVVVAADGRLTRGLDRRAGATY
jgi:hypothetical protein